MNDEPDAPKRGGMPGMMLAHVVCCGGVLLFVTGALSLSAIGAWLSEGGLAWLAAGAAALAVGFWARRRLRAANHDGPVAQGSHQAHHRSRPDSHDPRGVGVGQPTTKTQ